MLHGYKIVFQYEMVSLTNEQYAWHLILSRVSILPQVVVLHSWNWDIITSSTSKLDYQLLLRKKSLHSSPNSGDTRHKSVMEIEPIHPPHMINV